MPLQKTVVSYAMTAGVDTKTDPKQIQGKLSVLENGIFVTPKEIRKRNGFSPLSNSTFSSTTISNGIGTASFKNELLAMDGVNLYSYSPAVSKWANKGPLVNLSVTSTPAVRNSNRQTTQDSVTHPSGLQIFTFEDSSGGVRYSLFDTNTNQSVINNALVDSSGVRAKPCVLGNYFVIFYVNTSTGRIRFRSISIGAPTVLTAYTDFVTSLNSSNQLYDVSVFNNVATVVFNNNSGSISLRNLNAYLNIGSLSSYGSDPATNALTIFPDNSGNFWIFYCNGTATKGFIVKSDLSGTLLSATTIETVVSRNITGNFLNGKSTIFYEIAGSNEYSNHIRTNSLTSSGTVGTAANLLRSVGLVSKSFIYNNAQYMVTGYGPGPTSSTTASVQPTYFLINATGNIIGKISNQTAGGVTTESILCEVNQIETGVFQFAFLQKDSITTVSGNVFSFTGVMSGTLDFVDAQFQTVELGSNLHFTGGLLSVYDGATVTEHGFLVAPESVTVSTVTGSGSIAAGSYEYQVIYVWTDAQGQVHQSTPSVGVTQVTTTSNSTNTLTIPTLRLTSKTNVQIIVYRTTANQTTFYALNQITNTLTNDPTVDSLTFTDTFADSTIIGNAQLYTTGGVIENVSTPATQVIGTFQNRLILIPSENPLTWWYSQQVVPGAPVQLNDTFVNNIAQEGGSITAVAQMDTNLILFKEAVSFYVTGEGPSPNGQNNDLTDALLISSDTGCVNAKSLVLTPNGLMYQSNKGIYLLNRQLSDSYIGADVEGFNSANVTSSQLLPTVNQARFTLDSGVCLVFDFFVDQWSIFTNIAGNDSTIWQNNFVYINDSGIVQVETPGIYNDNGAFIKLRLVSGWISFSGIQAFQRVYRMMLLGEYKSPHQLLVQTAYDFNNVFTQQDYLNPTTILSPDSYGSSSPYGTEATYGGNSQVYQFRVDFSNQKCESIQVSIEDVQSTSYGEGYSLSAISFQVGQKQGLNRVPATRIFGS